MIPARWVRLVGMVATFALAGCAAVTREPPNLSPHKQQLRSYVESGQYQRDIAAVAARAKRWIEARAARGGEKLTVVFDLDETLLMNWPHMSEMDFGYVVPEWDKWVNEGKAPAIEPVREVYRAARRLNIDVVFITGRGENARDGTARNLRAIDCADYVALICKPAAHAGTSAAYKIEARRKLTAEGRTIIANIGDQESDLIGGYAERTFKLPNAFYLVE